MLPQAGHLLPRKRFIVQCTSLKRPRSSAYTFFQCIVVLMLLKILIKFLLCNTRAESFGQPPAVGWVSRLGLISNLTLSIWASGHQACHASMTLIYTLLSARSQACDCVYPAHSFAWTTSVRHKGAIWPLEALLLEISMSNCWHLSLPHDSKVLIALLRYLDNSQTSSLLLCA